ncbi:MAG: sulfatase-like hydrolase/transferase [Ferruginibacter sp.]
MFWFIYGFLRFEKPLTRQDAYRLNDNFKSYLALNPFQNFIASLKQRRPDFNTSGAANYYSTIGNFLQLDGTQTKNSYERTVLPNSHGLESKPNIVLVVCESFSMYKSSMSGNKLNTTPYFNQLCKNGIFFDRCFTPTFGTARGIFATVTGIPDVQLAKFSTLNPDAVNQQTIINNFEYQCLISCKKAGYLCWRNSTWQAVSIKTIGRCCRSSAKSIACFYSRAYQHCRLHPHAHSPVDVNTKAWSTCAAAFLPPSAAL